MIKKTISLIITVLLLLTFLITGCEDTPIEIIPEISDPPDNTLTASYVMDNGRSYSISGRGSAMPGEQLEYTLNISNNDEPWHLEYYVFLIDSESVIQEVCHDSFDIQSQGGMGKPFHVTIPEQFTGGVGLCFIVPQQTSFVVTISDAITTGWPDLSDYCY